MLADAYLHTLDPFAIQLTETIGLRWYGLAYITGFAFAWFIIQWMGKNKLSLIPYQKAGDLIFTGVIGVLIGGRVGYCLFYDPQLIYTFTTSFPFWKLLAIQDGGMSSHGGMIGVLIAFIFFGKKNNIPILHLLDIAPFAAAPGLFFGRIANFINGELWGKAIHTTQQQSPPFWSIKYPTEITEVWIQNPNLYENKIQKLEELRSTIPGETMFYQSIISEINQGNQAVIDFVAPLLTSWYPSQIFQALAEGPVIFIGILITWWYPRKPGVIASVFLILYGLTRISTEFFRQPDEGVELIASLSRGQVLSVVMIFSGIILFIFSQLSTNKKTGGFGSLTKNTTTS